MTQEALFDVVFTGEVVDGFASADVKAKAAGLFKMDAKQIDNLFQSGAIALKKSIDAKSAEKYKALLAGIGMVVELKACQLDAAELGGSGENSSAENHLSSNHVSSNQVSSSQLNNESEEIKYPDFSLVPQPCDILRPEERSQTKPFVSPPSLDGLTLSPEGEDLLKENEKSTVEPISIDVSDLVLEEIEDDVVENEGE